MDNDKGMTIDPLRETAALPPDSKIPVVDVIDSRSILGNRAEVVIRHQKELYRLRATRSGRLLLNK